MILDSKELLNVIDRLRSDPFVGSSLQDRIQLLHSQIAIPLNRALTRDLPDAYETALSGLDGDLVVGSLDAQLIVARRIAVMFGLYDADDRLIRLIDTREEQECGWDGALSEAISETLRKQPTTSNSNGYARFSSAIPYQTLRAENLPYGWPTDQLNCDKGSFSQRQDDFVSQWKDLMAICARAGLIDVVSEGARQILI